MEKSNKKPDTHSSDQENLPGYPHYPAGEDITRKENNEGEESLDDEDKDEDISELGLDIPGSGDDNADEEIGEEDEENNYYSLGGDNHEDLEEDKGE